MGWDGEGFRVMLDRLAQVRLSMDGAKNTNLMTKWADYGDYRNYKISGIIDHLIDEMDELDYALKYNGPSEIRNEALDVANCLEFLWDVLELAKA